MVLPEMISKQTLRVIDANLNRIGEGLRLLEDMARLMLDDTILTQKLKTMRHQLITTHQTLNQQFLQARNSASDVGINLSAPQQARERELTEIVVANARRVQEALRVIEELAKISDINLDSEKFKKARFDLYAIERDLFSRILRRDKLEHIFGLYAKAALNIGVNPASERLNK